MQKQNKSMKAYKMTLKNKPPFRYDIVGSFLRPAALKEKRQPSLPAPLRRKT